jgi:hypothetical protein
MKCQTTTMHSRTRVFITLIRRFKRIAVVCVVMLSITRFPNHTHTTQDKLTTHPHAQLTPRAHIDSLHARHTPPSRDVPGLRELDRATSCDWRDLLARGCVWLLLTRVARRPERSVRDPERVRSSQPPSRESGVRRHCVTTAGDSLVYARFFRWWYCCNWLWWNCRWGWG